VPNRDSVLFIEEQHFESALEVETVAEIILAIKVIE